MGLMRPKKNICGQIVAKIPYINKNKEGAIPDALSNLLYL